MLSDNGDEMNERFIVWLRGRGPYGGRIPRSVLGFRAPPPMIVRHDYSLYNYFGFVHLGCIVILLR